MDSICHIVYDMDGLTIFAEKLGVIHVVHILLQYIQLFNDFINNGAVGIQIFQ